MKKLITVFVSSALVSLFVSTPIVAQTATPVPTVKSTGAAANNLVAPTPSGMVEEKNDYLLPYPGILPDHPLYFLKSLRDKILEALIVDPLRKSEFYLLQADKRLNMGVSFATKGVQDKAAQMVTEAEAFMDTTMKGLAAFKNSGSQVPGSTIDRLEKALAKHIEVLENMVANAGEAEGKIISQALEKAKALQAGIEQLK